jgi:threonine dehydratase
MKDDEQQPWLAGVDGCPGGWVAVFCRLGRHKEATVEVVRHFVDIVADRRAPMVIAVDMPIGLPDRSTAGGREAERCVRLHLGPRRASVFSIPSRAAVLAHGEGYETVCTIARQTSEPPWAPSKQAFHIFPRIMEIDRALRDDPEMIARVHEVHPELAFALMNEAPLNEPKKRRGCLHTPGLAARRALLLKEGFTADFLDAPLPRGEDSRLRAARDDFYDACATLWSAARIHAGSAALFPPVPDYDAAGLPMVIRG